LYAGNESPGVFTPAEKSDQVLIALPIKNERIDGSVKINELHFLAAAAHRFLNK
jgi:hypothetical protein